MNTFVIVNGNKIPTNKVKFLNIEEDFMGRDLMTFEFQGKVYSSLVYSGSYD